MCKNMQRAITPTEPELADEKYLHAKFGLTHTIVYNLRKAGKIRSISTKGEGQKYGKRLFSVPSVREWIAEQEARELAGSEVKG